MLYQLTSTAFGFKSIQFKAGLNIVVADREQAEGDDQAGGNESARRTRNGAGKSSIVDLVHFALGGEAKGVLKSPVLEKFSCSLQLDVGLPVVTARRSVADTGHVYLVSSDSPAHEEKLTNSKWCDRLGAEWFRLEAKRPKGAASYRQLISYFARRKRDGGFDDPVRTFRASSAATNETALAALFGLDSELVRRLHSVKAELKGAQTAQKALAAMEKVASPGHRQSELEAQLAAQIAASSLTRDRLQDRIQAFNVLPEFRELEQELAKLNQDHRDLSDRDVLDREVLAASRRALEAEKTSESPDVERLFNEASIVLPDLIQQRYADVAKFHARLIENRRSQLENEITSASRRIEERQPAREKIEVRRRQITASLRSSGPADELLRLRDELATRDAEIRGLQARREEARRLEDRTTQLIRDEADAVRALRQDRREREKIVNEASTTFSEISEMLYETPGALAISASEGGLKFSPTTPSDGSAGVMSMEVFCFDWTIASLCQRRGLGPGFLIHDSHLFEPVDGRQFARALRIAARLSASTGIQYVVLLNSDELERAEREGSEDFAEFVLPTKLSDAPDGGLFGKRFD